MSDKKMLKFGEIYIEKRKFHVSKNPTGIKDFHNTLGILLVTRIIVLMTQNLYLLS